MYFPIHLNICSVKELYFTTLSLSSEGSIIYLDSRKGKGGWMCPVRHCGWVLPPWPSDPREVGGENSNGGRLALYKTPSPQLAARTTSLRGKPVLHNTAEPARQGRSWDTGFRGRGSLRGSLLPVETFLLLKKKNYGRTPRRRRGRNECPTTASATAAAGE